MSATRLEIKAKAAGIAADRALMRLQARTFEERVRSQVGSIEGRMRWRATAPDTLALSFLAGFALGELAPALGRVRARSERPAAVAEPGLLQTLVRAAAPVIAAAGVRRITD